MRLTEKLEEHYITRYERVNGKIIGNQMCIDKLGELEDLEEQCIEENRCGLRELLLKWKAFFGDIAELYDYRKAEEQGLLLRLPVAVGTTVYNTTWWDDKEKFVRIDGKLFFTKERKYKVTKSKFSLLDIEEFGKTVFLTREEAEAALAEKGGAE